MPSEFGFETDSERAARLSAAAAKKAAEAAAEVERQRSFIATWDRETARLNEPVSRVLTDYCKVKGLAPRIVWDVHWRRF